MEMSLAGVSVREVMEQLGIGNKTQKKTCMRRYRTGEVHRLEQQNGPSKKVQGTGKEVEPEVPVAWIESIRDEVTVSEACTWLGIARATYYRWKAAVETERTEAMAEKISELCIHSPRASSLNQQPHPREKSHSDKKELQILLNDAEHILPLLPEEIAD
nr:hypothetical protein [Paenibacillus polymyxa]